MFDQSIILAFHQTSRKFYPGINNIKPGYFFDIIDLCRQWGFGLWHRDTQNNPKYRNRNIVITFDDGYAANFEVLARLCEMGTTPFLFIPTDYIGKNNSWEYSSRLFPARHLDEKQLRQLADMGVIIGSHGRSHRSFTVMTCSRAKHELADSKKHLEYITGGEVGSISFPFGRTSSVINKTARDCGYRIAFGLDIECVEEQRDTFVSRRTAIYSIDDYYSLRGKLVVMTNLEKIKNRIINDLSAGTIIVSGRLN